ncbi:hypothetical protein AVEN_193172-1 [Araneus ventricosus]|uniref:Uncharacterized protein n=1 Tax=Araneus ventricosus TaxID=182803 RepID=A0A4Y2B050_ARAVE|nr:hypothetical protein AVEN_193172-1 [Araneus ventricosus]
MKPKGKVGLSIPTEASLKEPVGGSCFGALSWTQSSARTCPIILSFKHSPMILSWLSGAKSLKTLKEEVTRNFNASLTEERSTNLNSAHLKPS